jgi:hypothetical protein
MHGRRVRNMQDVRMKLAQKFAHQRMAVQLSLFRPTALSCTFCS